MLQERDRGVVERDLAKAEAPTQERVAELPRLVTLDCNLVVLGTIAHTPAGVVIEQAVGEVAGK